MPNPGKLKGLRAERAFVARCREKGLEAERVYASGAHGEIHEDLSGDVVVEGLRGEVKHRQNLNQQLWDWLEGMDFLALKRDRQEFLVVVRLEDFIAWVKPDRIARYGLRVSLPPQGHQIASPASEG